MSDSDGSPQRDDRHHRRSRSRSPVSPGCAGETLAEREEQPLAQAAVPVGPPAEEPQAATNDPEPPAQEPVPAGVAAPATQAAAPAAPPPGGGGGCARGRDRGPGRSRRGPRHAAGAGDGPHAGPGPGTAAACLGGRDLADGPRLYFPFHGSMVADFCPDIASGFQFSGGLSPFGRQQKPWPWGASAPRTCGLALADSGSEVSRVFWVRMYPPEIRSIQCVLRRRSGPPPPFSLSPWPPAGNAAPSLPVNR